MALGYDGSFAAGLRRLATGSASGSNAERGLVPGRVACEHRGRYEVLGEHGAWDATLAGRLRHEACAREQLPAVGDWVALRAAAAPPKGGLDAEPGGGAPHRHAAIVGVLERRSVIARAAAGTRVEAQVVAANVDLALLVTSPNQDLNPRRMERFLATVWEGGASPLLVLNKCDLVEDAAAWLAELSAAVAGVEAVAVSASRGDGLEALRVRLGAGRTAVLLGSSGVGKSTLVNALAGVALDTGPIRTKDDRGRHTTTRRELFALPGGGLVIDTPGLRGIEPWAADEAVAEVYADIEDLALGCRFRDCAHEGEPGCAVEAAVADGALDAARLSAWHRIRREQAYQERKRSTSAATEERRRWKVLHQGLKSRPGRRT